jgi:thioredoxin-like negative regulator of GroEL
VEIDPKHIYHRLELAEVYVDLGRYSKAREQLMVIPTLPNADALDAENKVEAAALLEDIKGEKDEK